MSDSGDLGRYKCPAPVLYELIITALINLPDFNPFTALGLTLIITIPADIRPTYLRFMRYRYENAITRFLTITTNFPL